MSSQIEFIDSTGVLTSIENNQELNFLELVSLAQLDPRKDFVGADLAEIDLSDQNLHGYNFSDSNLSNALISGARFDECDFSNANLENVNLSEAVFDNCVLDRHLEALVQAALKPDAAASEEHLGAPTVARSRKNIVTKAIIPVADLGTRFLPTTKSIPKEMMNLVDRPIIQYIVDEARASGITDFIFVTNGQSSIFESYFSRSPALEGTLRQKGKQELLEAVQQTSMDSGTLSFIQQNQPLGLGHAVWCARRLIGDEPFAVLLADDIIVWKKPCLAQMIEAYEETGASIVAALELPRDRISDYGCIDILEDNGRLLKIRGLVEKPAMQDAPSNLGVVGRYIFNPEILQHLSGLKPGAGGEVQLTDAMAKLIGSDSDILAFRFSGQRFDCGSKQGLLQANMTLALARSDLNDEFRAFMHEMLPVLQTN